MRMYTPQGFDHEIRNLYIIVHNFYGNVWNATFYIVVMALLGFHLSHGFWSAFQSLGLNGSRFTPLAYGIGLVYAIIMSVGFVLLPALSFIYHGGLL